MKPGPVADKIDIKGGKDESLQIRMDEMPDAQINNAFATEIEQPSDWSDPKFMWADDTKDSKVNKISDDGEYW